MSGDSLDTRAVHAGEPDPRPQGSVVQPIYQSATFEFAGGEGEELRYLRYGNAPDQRALEAKLADLEGAEAGLALASGMAAITTTLMALLSPGDHLIAQRGLYGGTHGLLARTLERFSVGVDFVNAARPEEWEARRRPRTRVFYVETISNPTMRVGELDRIAAFGREHGLTTVVDNTFATPVNFRPPEHGFDLSVHSATKYLNGHSDLVAGAVLGRGDRVAGVRELARTTGPALDPHAGFLLRRGLKTLALRVRRQNETAGRLARFLDGHPAVESVCYPGLESSNDHERARRLLDGFGGMLSFEPRGGAKTAGALLGRLRIPVVAPSLGGVETLVSRPAVTSHAGLSPERRLALGITDGMVRVSVGIEGAEDLLEDFGKALEGL